MFDDDLLAAELNLLDRYHPESALDLLRDLVARDPSDYTARVQLVACALRLDRLQEAASQLHQLPSVEIVDAQQGATVVAILGHFGKHREAVLYAYDLLRRHFGDHRAHRALRDATIGERDEVLEDVVIVGPGSAVAVEEAGETRWFVIEDSTIAAANVENEIRPDSPTAKMLLGKHVGDEVVLSDAVYSRRTATVREIVSKVTYRVRDVFSRWQYRFPEKQEMWMIQLASGPNGQPDFRELFAMQAEAKERADRADAAYATQPLPVAVYAHVLGTSEIEASIRLAVTSTVALRCCSGTAQERTEAHEALSAASRLVIDLSAITTLALLDVMSALSTSGKRIVLARKTHSAIRALVQRRGGNAQSDNAKGDPFARAVTWIDEHCLVEDAPEVAELQPQMREQCGRAFGPSGLDSVIISTRPGYALWTDDQAMADLSARFFGVRRVWTQFVLQSLAEHGAIDEALCASAAAKLIGWGYQFTSATRASLSCGGALAEWDPERWPLKQVVGYLGAAIVRPGDAVILAGLLIVDAYRDAVLPERRTQIAIAIFESLAHRPDHRPRAFLQLRRICRTRSD